MTLFELFGLLRKHLGFVIAVSIACTAVTAVVCYFLPNTYTATTTMYVLSKSNGDTASNVATQSDLSAGQMLTNDVAAIVKSDRVKKDVASQLGLESLADYKLNVTSSTTTRVITLSVTGTDPSGSAVVANAFVRDVSLVAQDVMGVESVNVIDSAVAPEEPSGPNRILYTLVGLVGGLLLAIMIVSLRDAMDTRVKDSVDVERLLGVPVIGHFPSLERM